MEKVFISPAKYVQGENLLKTGGKYVKPLGKKAIMVCDDICWEIAGKDLSETLNKEEIEVKRVGFAGESTKKAMDEITEIAKTGGYDMILAVGGGKTIDTARAVGEFANIKVGVFPTTASTDAPTASLYAIYSEDGVLEGCYFTKNPDLVMVDTTIISKAPVRFLASGIADALATWVEASACKQKHGVTTAFGEATIAGLAIAEKCEETIFKYGIQAYEANLAKVVTPALEYIIEANTLLSGIGYESGGLAAAHAVHDALTVLPGEIHHLTHGEKVAFGTLTQLFLEERSDEELKKFISFYRRLGLPTTFKDLKIPNITREELQVVGEAALAPGRTIVNMPFAVSADQVVAAMMAVDRYVTDEFSN